MDKILTACTFCRHPVTSTEQWLLTNSILFCNTCCKSFTPKEYQVYKEEEETSGDIVEKVRYDNDEYKVELTNDYIVSDDWECGEEE